MLFTKSIKNHIIRLTDERWKHISQGHRELAPYKLAILSIISEPEVVLLAKTGEHLAIKKFSGDKYLIVIYKDRENGFIITAFISSKIKQILNKRKIIYGKIS